MIVTFKNQATEDIYNGVASKFARKVCPQSIWRVVSRKLDQLDSVITLEELRIPPGNRLETLFGDRKNEQYGICFKWGESGPYDVEITDYH